MAGKELAILKRGGGTKRCGVVLTLVLDVLTTLKGEVQKVSNRFYPVLRGGGCNKFQTGDFLIFIPIREMLDITEWCRGLTRRSRVVPLLEINDVTSVNQKVA